MHENYMRMALDLAVKAKGRTSPNPMVGAVIVKDGKIVGQGFHAKAGTFHAEIVALNEAKEMARGADIYVTLEPCCHYGRTGPCTEALLKAGIKRAFVAMEDPNPKVKGKGIKRLRDCGVEVVTDMLHDEAVRLNEVFIKHITTGFPFVGLKTAMSLDGKIATPSGESKWITGSGARLYGHVLRDEYDAILVGIGTVLKDDPALTCRREGQKGRDPVRIILDSTCRVPPEAKVLSQTSDAAVIIACAIDAPVDRKKSLQARGATIIEFERDQKGVGLVHLLSELGQRGITSILVEGGAIVGGSFMEAGLVDKIHWFIAPKVIGGNAPGPIGGAGVAKLAEAPAFKFDKVTRYGDDLCIEGYPVRGCVQCSQV